jgi:RNA polymerase sigma-70 factor (ECF subfamily)
METKTNQLLIEAMHNQEPEQGRNPERKLEHIPEHKLERESFELRLEQLHAALFRYCLSLTGSVQDAEDLSQHTWAKTIRRLAEHGHANPEAFLLRVAKNGWIDECRRRKGLRERLQWLSELGGNRKEGERPEAERAIAALMRHLSPIQRTVFLLRDALGYSIAETSELLESSEGAVKAALHRARRGLADVREACRLDLDDADREGWMDAEAEELARRILLAYSEGRTEELIALVQSQPAGSDGLLVVGHYAQGPMGQSSGSLGPQASFSYGMSSMGMQASVSYGMSSMGMQASVSYGMPTFGAPASVGYDMFLQAMKGSRAIGRTA